MMMEGQEIAAAPPSQVQLRFTSIQNTASELKAALEELRSRLHPVLMPERPQNVEPDSQDKQQVCPFAEEMDGLLNSLDRDRQLVADLISRLEL